LDKLGLRIRTVALVLLLFFRCVRKIAKSDYWLRHICPSVCPHWKTRL